MASFFVHAANFSDVVGAGGDELHAVSVARDEVGVAPAVALAEPQKVLAVVDPLNFVHHVHPGGILIAENLADLAGGGVGEQHIVGILQAIQMLDGEFAGISGPLEARDVIVAGIAGDVHPAAFLRHPR